MKQEMKLFLRNSFIALVCTVIYHFVIFGLGMPTSDGGAGWLGASIFFFAGNAGLFLVGRYCMRRSLKEWKNVLSVTVIPICAAVLTCRIFGMPPIDNIWFFGAGTLMRIYSQTFKLWALAAVMATVMPYIMFCGGILMRKEDLT